jgi:hypothetical protein
MKGGTLNLIFRQIGRLSLNYLNFVEAGGRTHPTGERHDDPQLKR